MTVTTALRVAYEVVTPICPICGAHLAPPITHTDRTRVETVTCPCGTLVLAQFVRPMLSGD